MATKKKSESMRERLYRLASNKSMLWLVSTIVFFAAFAAMLIWLQVTRMRLQQAESLADLSSLQSSAQTIAIQDEASRGVKVQEYSYQPVANVKFSLLSISGKFEVQYIKDSNMLQFRQGGKVLVRRCKWSGSTQSGYKCTGGVLLEANPNANLVADEKAGPQPEWKVAKVFEANPTDQEWIDAGFPAEYAKLYNF